MKKWILMLVLPLLWASSTQANFTKASLQASGLTCSMCTKAINKSLEKLPFISTVKADIKTSTFTIEFKEGASVDIDQIKNAVEAAGFSVAQLQLTGSFNNQEVKNDSHIVFDGKTFHFLGIKPSVLNGEQTIKVVDKNFVDGKEFKKISATSKMKCVQTGKAESCCHSSNISSSTRIYHVTI